MFRSQSTISVWFLAGGRTVRNTLPCVDQLLFHRHKLNVHRRESLDLLARGREAPGIRINPENDQAIGVLVGGDQVTAGRIDPETAWCLSLRGYPLDWRDGALGGIHGEHCDA